MRFCYVSELTMALDIQDRGRFSVLDGKDTEPSPVFTYEMLEAFNEAVAGTIQIMP